MLTKIINCDRLDNKSSSFWSFYMAIIDKITKEI